MSKKYDFYVAQYIIDLLVKAAAIVLTSSATLNVAREAFSQIEEPWFTAIQVAAIILIEGAFLASWLAIDTQHHAPMAMKVAWSVTLIAIYVALMVLALEHGEGMAGWAFRLVLAVMIGRSIYEAGVYEVLRNRRKEDQDVRSSRAVRRIQRQLMKKNAVKSMKLESVETNYARQLRAEVDRARIDAEHEAALVDIHLMRERLSIQVQQDDVLQRQRQHLQILQEEQYIRKMIAAPEVEREEQPSQVTPPAGIIPGAEVKTSNAGLTETKIKQMLVKQLNENPNRSVNTLSRITCTPVPRVEELLKALAVEGALSTSAKSRSGYVPS